MKKYLLFLTIFIIVISSVSLSSARKKTETDIGFLYGSDPIPNYNLKAALGLTGLSGGFGADIIEAKPLIFNIRFDMTMLIWKDTQTFGSLHIWRLPLFLGVRAYFEVTEWFLPYLEIGPEVSFDWASGTTSSTGFSSGTHFGASGGAGINIPIKRLFMIGVNFRYHLISNSYFTVGPIIGTRW